MNRLNLYGLVITIIACGCGMEKPSAKLNSDGNIIAVTEPNGGLLWRKRFQEKISKSLVCDFDGDGKYEVLIAMDRYDYRHRGLLFLYDHAGDLLWNRSFVSDTFTIPFKRSATQGNEGEDYIIVPQVERVWTSDLDSDNKDEIILSLNVARDFNPMAICVINISNQLQGLFWNPGAIKDVKEIQSDKNSSKSMVILGVNNEFTTMEEKGKAWYRFVLFKLDSRILEKESMEYIHRAPSLKDKYTCSSCSWYRILPRYPGSLHEIDNHIRILDENDNLTRIEVRYGGHIITLNGMGEIQKVDLTLEFKSSELLNNDPAKIEAYKQSLLEQSAIYRCHPP